MTARTRPRRAGLPRPHVLWIFALLTVMLQPAVGVLSPSDAHAATITQRQSMAQPLRVIRQNYSHLPLRFEINRGQVDHRVEFFARLPNSTVFLTERSAVVSLWKTPRTTKRGHSVQRHQLAQVTSAIRLGFVGASSHPQVVGLDQLSGRTNYLLGKDPSKWRTKIATYGRVMYRGLYPGIDLVFYGQQGHLEYDWIVHPGANPARIHLGVQGSGGMHLDRHGDLILQTALGTVSQPLPTIYEQVGHMRRAISGAYVLAKDGIVNIHVGKYDTSRPLIIDPSLVYSTYLGGSIADGGTTIKVDSSGNTYVAGFTYSSDFPLLNPFQSVLRGRVDVFVAKLNSTGTALYYSTYLGGSDSDEAAGIAINSAGNAFVTGNTSSYDFPTQNPIQASLGTGATCGGTVPPQPVCQDIFVTELSASGSALIYSTYLGGSGTESSGGIALDSAGNAYVAGTTDSATTSTTTGFPTCPGTASICASTGTPLQATNAGNQDGFVAKLNASGSALVYSTYLGGSYGDGIGGIAVDGAGSAYVTGSTSSTDFPTRNPFQAANAGYQDAFIAKLNPAGTSLVYSTYLGGGGNEHTTGIAVDGSGNAYVAGQTESYNFPTARPIQASNRSALDTAFVSELNAAGSALVYSTYLGGSVTSTGQGNSDGAIGIAVDPPGDAYVTGYTNATDFPVKNALQSTIDANQVAFVTEFAPLGTSLVFSTYLGGGNDTEARGIAVSSVGQVYVTGRTYASNYYLCPSSATYCASTGTPYQSTNMAISISGYGYTGFVTVFVPQAATTHFGVSAPATATTGHSFTVTITALKADGTIDPNYQGTVTVSSTDPGVTLPPATFSSTDAGVHTVTVTLSSPGWQTISATDSANSAISGTSPAIATTQLTSTGSSTISTQVAAGWNMVGGSPLTLWNGSSTAWAFNALTQTWYHPTGNEAPGTAIWQNASAAGSQSATVQSCSGVVTVPVVAYRWNLVGNPCGQTVTLPSTAHAYTWDATTSRYLLVTTIAPGAAAWVKPVSSLLTLTPTTSAAALHAALARQAAARTVRTHTTDLPPTPEAGRPHQTHSHHSAH